MTATCTLCGLILTTPDDPVLDASREDRTFSLLGALYRKHFNQSHSNEPQDCLPPGSLPDGATVAQMVGVMGITVQAAILFSYLKSEDPAFQDKSNQMRECVVKSMEPKEMKSLVSLGKTAVLS